ncbi:hypothetical protein K5X82_08640 [Halosquirtibacter xylanolyticus]|uniref:hypothetical protein n=1 Tax=Halosquirtibacter xylanolyticus TaxID=3374599 RepID=UPI0037485E83|nr:hypothetical protein K5X82_08640 [Prolixibacteraceae bacterium]
MRITFTSIFLLFFSIVMCQEKKEITVIDKSTRKPIELVHVYYPNLDIGSISNAEGVVKIDKQLRDTIAFSNVAFKTKIIVSDIALPDTVYLEPSDYFLDEIVVGYNLRKKIEEVLQYYNENYLISSSLNRCTYKEVIKVDDNISRLNQVQLDWWSKKSSFRKRRKLENENKFSLRSIDYAKRDTAFVSKCFLNNRYLLPRLYISWYLDALLKIVDDNTIIINKVEKNHLQTKVVFSTNDYIKEGSLLYNLVKNYIIFDNKSNAVTEIYWNAVNKDEVRKRIRGKSGEKFTIENKRQVFHLSLQKLNNNKWTINYFHSRAIAEVFYQGKKHQTDIEQGFVITGVSKDKLDGDIIDIDRPFYLNFPTHTSIKNTLVLTKEELQYINKK